jgi:DNA-binding SARP family transcriptional activator/tetratricopeptide (TPR) repeat protein
LCHHPRVPRTPKVGVGQVGLELQLFGRVAFQLNGAALHVPVRKLAGLIAYLALEGPSSRSKLAGLLWSELNEADARRNLRQRLYRLSPPELAGFVLADASLISLNSLISSDAAEFERAMLESDFARAVGLYHGLLLDGLELEEASAFHDWLDRKRDGFDRAFQRALAGLADQLETAGSRDLSLQQHLRLIEINPLLELHQRHVMRLRGLSGERAEALTGFERFRDLLESELGLEPMPETLHLAEQIRRQDTLEARVTRPVIQVLPSNATVMIGRQAVLDQLEVAWETDQIVLINGEPGVGKSRLLQEFAAKRTVVFAQGRAGDATIPYATQTRVIRRLLEENPQVVLPRWVHQELSRLIPSLDQTPPPGGPEARIRLFDAVAEFMVLNTQAAGTYIIDDLQFFDLESFEMGMHVFGQLAERGHGKRLLMAYRTGELSSAMTLVLEQKFTASGGVHAVQIDLEPLDELALRGLVQHLFGSPDPVLFARRLHKATGGNPFFALETLKSLVESNALQQNERGEWSTPFDDTTQAYAELSMPESVLAAVRERVTRLGVEAIRLLETASLAGDAFRLEDLQTATTLTEFEALEAFERALELRLLERFDGRLDGRLDGRYDGRQTEAYRFSHDLVREALAIGLSGERKRLLHRKLAETLENHAGPAARIAEHLERAGQRQSAGSWRVKAAKAAMQVYAPREAIREYELALEDEPEATLERAEILDNMVVLLWRQNEFERAVGWANELASIRETNGDQLGLARAEIVIGVLEMSLGFRQPALESFERALERARLINNIEYQARTLINLAKLHTDIGDVQSAMPVIEAGLALGDTISLDEQAMFETAQTYCALLGGDLGLAVMLAPISIRKAEASDIPFAKISAMVLALDVYLGLGAVMVCERLLTEVGELIERHDFGYHRAEHAIKSAWLELERGRPLLALEAISVLVHDDVAQPEDQASVAWITAASHLKLHEPLAALEALQDLKAAPTLEVWARVLTVRLQAALEAGIDLTEHIRAAQAQLASDRTPALEGLKLRQALAFALEHNGESGATTEVRQIAFSRLREMALTLEAQPELQQSFLEKFHDLT